MSATTIETKKEEELQVQQELQIDETIALIDELFYSGMTIEQLEQNNEWVMLSPMHDPL